jgi:hypothetical protein
MTNNLAKLSDGEPLIPPHPLVKLYTDFVKKLEEGKQQDQ